VCPPFQHGSYFHWILWLSPRVCCCSGPREDATRIGSAGVVRRQAVDISPLRRVNQVGASSRDC